MNNLHPAMFWNSDESGKVSCLLCTHNCKIPSGKTGLCGVRKNIDGTLYATSYGQVSSIALDPIEKKPLYMFHPGTRVLSIGSFGCNLRCPFCQNCEISMDYDKRLMEAKRITPEQVAGLAERHVPDGNIGVAYTYNEPLIGYEFVFDCAKLIHEAGMKNILVTNGYITREPFEKLLPYIDAMNIDLKGFTEGFYKKLGGSFEPVKEIIKTAHTHCHVEITTLVIPGENDSDEEIEALAKWLASLDPNIPLHLTRFFPRHKYTDKMPTPKETIFNLCEIARRYLANVFVGNIG